MSGSPTPARGLGEIVDELALSEQQREILRSRWLDQLGWMSARARVARRRYYIVRVPSLVLAVLTPVLISLSLGEPEQRGWQVAALVASFGFTLLTAFEEVFHFREAWRNYRGTSERLKSLGWQYASKVGPFRRFDSHAAAFPSFAERVEEILGEDVEGYLERVAAEAQAGRTNPLG